MARLDDYLAGLRLLYPGCVILMHQGNWYRAWDQDADVMHRILNWNVDFVNGHRMTSGSVSVNITNALKAYGYAYKIIQGTTVIETYDPSSSNFKLTATLNSPMDGIRTDCKVTAPVDISKLVYGVSVGDTVYHYTKFGRGTIKSIADGYITVQFGFEEKKFEFPDAFIKKYLQAPGFVIPPNVNKVPSIKIPTYVQLPKQQSNMSSGKMKTNTQSGTKKSNTSSGTKKSNTSSSGYGSRHGGGWVDDAWVPGLPSSRFFRKKKRF